MKRGDLLRHLRKHGCLLLREGSGHSIFWNPAIGKSAAVPRHREVPNNVARAICSQLEIPPL